MDINKYIKSDTLKRYWENIGFKPDPLASAFLVDSNCDAEITLKQRQADLLCIAKGTENLYIKKGRFDDVNDYFDKVIKKKIRLEKKMVKDFYNQSSDVPFTGNIFSHYQGKYIELPKFKTFDEFKKYCSRFDFYNVSCIRHFDNDLDIGLNLNKDFSVVDIDSISGNRETGGDLSAIFNFVFPIPSPFREGDHVTLARSQNNSVYRVLDIEDPSEGPGVHLFNETYGGDTYLVVTDIEKYVTHIQ